MALERLRLSFPCTALLACARACAFACVFAWGVSTAAANPPVRRTFSTAAARVRAARVRTQTSALNRRGVRFAGVRQSSERAAELYRIAPTGEDITHRIELPIAREADRRATFAKLYRQGRGQLRYTRPARSTNASQPEIVETLRSAGVDPRNAELAAAHVQLGMPSAATTQSRRDFLIARRDMVIAYDEEHVGPSWIAWTTTPRDITKARPFKRRDAFRDDPWLPADMPAATLEDYLDDHGHVDIGHVVRAAERATSPRTADRTFVLTNTLPQAAASNQGPWLGMEDFLLERVRAEGKTVLTLAGPIWGNNPPRFGRNRVAVPQAMWKVAVVLEQGQTLADVTANTPVYAGIFPNSSLDIQEGDAWTDYQVTPLDVERATGLQFFTHVQAPVADALRNAFVEIR